MLVSFELDHCDNTVVSQTPPIIRMGPIIHLVISHKVHLQCCYTVSLPSLLALRICGKTTRDILNLSLEHQKETFQHLLEFLEIKVVENDETNEKELLARFCVSDVLFQVAHVNIYVLYLITLMSSGSA